LDYSIELLAIPSKKATVNERGEANFTIGNVKIYSSDRELTDDLEKTIAFYLMRFGTWNECKPEAIYDDGNFKGIRFISTPDFPPEEQKFSMIGELSSMVSSSYGEQTIYEKSVIALDTNLEPSIFSVEIPDGYKGKDLPLWQFVMQPNSDFR